MAIVVDILYLLIGIGYLVGVATLIVAVVMHLSSRQPRTTESKLFKQVVLDDTCPDCGSRGFHKGRGNPYNLFCKNPDCRAGFIVLPFLGSVDRLKTRVPYHRGRYGLPHRKSS